MEVATEKLEWWQGSMGESNKGRFEQGYFGLHSNLVHEKKWEYSTLGKGKKKNKM